MRICFFSKTSRENIRCYSQDDLLGWNSRFIGFSNCCSANSCELGPDRVGGSWASRNRALLGVVAFSLCYLERCIVRSGLGRIQAIRTSTFHEEFTNGATVSEQ